jgi:DUF1365 family protein
MHHRLQPVAHGFRYGIYMHRLDLDELPALDRGLRLFGVNRWRPVAFHDSDHLGPAGDGMRARVDARLRAAGVTAAIDRVELVTQCRVLGYVFNPVSFYLCYGPSRALRAIVAEVHNTFGEQHCYVLPATEAGREAESFNPRTWHDKKTFHVSPFLTLDGTYRFQFTVADEHLDVRIDLHRSGQPVFVSRLSLDRRPLTDGGLVRVLLRYPLMTMRVVAAIHWQALRLWMKGVAYVPKPAYDPDLARTSSDA